MEEQYRLADAARLSGRTYKSLVQAWQKGLLRGKRVGNRSVYVTLGEVERYVEEHAYHKRTRTGANVQ